MTAQNWRGYDLFSKYMDKNSVPLCLAEDSRSGSDLRFIIYNMQCRDLKSYGWVCLMRRFIVLTSLPSACCWAHS